VILILKCEKYSLNILPIVPRPIIGLFDILAAHSYQIQVLYIFGRSPTGRAMRCNAFFAAGATQKNIFAAIPNAEKLMFGGFDSS
jgi:hypothetical protein